jgi:hypothetical protein
VGFGPLRYVSVEFGGSLVTQAAPSFYFVDERYELWANLVMTTQACHAIREFTRTQRIDFQYLLKQTASQLRPPREKWHGETGPGLFPNGEFQNTNPEVHLKSN